MFPKLDMQSSVFKIILKQLEWIFKGPGVTNFFDYLSFILKSRLFFAQDQFPSLSMACCTSDFWQTPLLCLVFCLYQKKSDAALGIFQIWNLF